MHLRVSVACQSTQHVERLDCERLQGLGGRGRRVEEEHGAQESPDVPGPPAVVTYAKLCPVTAWYVLSPRNTFFIPLEAAARTERCLTPWPNSLAPACGVKPYFGMRADISKPL